MAPLTNETATIESVLQQCVERYATPDARMFTVFDEQRGHFLVIEEGWLGKEHLYNPFVHVELQGGQIWVQQDYTNHGIANDLAGAGIPKERIVLGYKPISERNEVLYNVA
ncbi:MAG: XisI protein [Akkermansiaceae bacterium]|nr:XisI protein [Armatimonadota bacterium]